MGRRSDPGGRRWPLLVAAAVLAIALAGIVVGSIDSRSTTETGPADVSDQQGAPSAENTSDDDPTEPGPGTNAAAPTSPTAPEDPACAAWALVDHHLRESGDVFDPGSAEDLLGFRGFAPPELQADADRLLELAAVTPPPPERAEVLARLRSAIEIRCGPPAGG